MDLNISPEIRPPVSSPRKYNLSISFNFDVDGIDSDSTTDSEAPNLQIDVSEVINYQNARKRKHIEIEETSAINEMEEEIERQLDAKAAKTNLTATNVKNILRHVITNEHVLAMVQNSLHNTEEGGIFEPKLTRAKAKELAMAQSPTITWPITPVKKCTSEVQALINEDFHEDSSDEEYNPDQDQHSEDEHLDGEHLANSDLDSQPTTPAPVNEQIAEEKVECHENAQVLYDFEGLFKIPSVPVASQSEKYESIESIGQRTRSKLCLSETPLEHIEQAFIPPDITTDMYDWDCDMDEEWNKFLADFTQPLTHEPNNEDDPEADPEYNILEDRANDMVDKEEIRDDRAVKVSRKELKDLVAELFEDEDFFSMEPVSVEQETQKELPRKEKGAEIPTMSFHNSTDNPMVNLLPALAQEVLPQIGNFEHSNLIAIQFQQHVQLMVQHFVMTYQHPELHAQSKICKDNLNSISYLSTGEHSAFSVLNLHDALVLISDCEEKFRDEKFHTEYIEMKENEIKEGHAKKARKLKHIAKFHPEMIKLFMESKALMYPELLPHVPLDSVIENHRGPYLKSEEHLLALGLEQFIPFQEAKERKFPFKKIILMDALKSITEYLIPSKTAKALYGHTGRLRRANDDNPVRHYFQMGYVPSRIHCIALENIAKAPKDWPESSLPENWREIISKNSYGVANSSSGSSTIIRYLSESSENISVDENYLSPIVNMLPNMPNLDQTPQKKEPINRCRVDTNIGVATALITPQLRQTTPRLAKIRSAQNMRLMTQVSGPRNSPSPSVKSRAKGGNRKINDNAESSRGDNEDEIAELMLASTTIKKDSVNRKKAKQVREQETIKRMHEAETELAREERTTKFAASFMQKIHTILEGTNNADKLKTTIKLLADYSEKAEELKGASSESQDKLAIDFYTNLRDTFKEYPDITADLILFLKPHQAARLDDFAEYATTKSMLDFINGTQVYFAKQPAKMNRMMQSITIIGNHPKPTLEFTHSVMDSVLKGHPLVKDLFQSCIPCEKPPESLFQPHLFENLTCQIGSYDRHKDYTQDSPELYENIELLTPPTQEDPYGGDNCRCTCHKSNSSPTKTNNAEHCIACGLRYLNGRIYLQTLEGLRPAKITFPGDEENRQENIARVSLKTSERSSAAGSTGRRRKSSKNDNSPDESLLKQCPPKNSPNKETEEGSKSKRNVGGKSPPKYVDQRRLSKSSDTNSTLATPSQSAPLSETSPIKSKREKRAERREAKSDSKNLDSKGSSSVVAERLAPVEPAESTSTMDVDAEQSRRVDNSDSEIRAGEPVELEISKPDSDTTIEPQAAEIPWSRSEDAILLKHVQKNYSERTFVLVSETLGNRTVEQVKKRCATLLAIVQKMV